MSGYVPTLGMLRALTDAQHATPLDQLRCRLRGLADRRGQPTSAGVQAISRELKRRKDLQHG